MVKNTGKNAEVIMEKAREHHEAKAKKNIE